MFRAVANASSSIVSTAPFLPLLHGGDEPRVVAAATAAPTICLAWLTLKLLARLSRWPTVVGNSYCRNCNCSSTLVRSHEGAYRLAVFIASTPVHGSRKPKPGSKRWMTGEWCPVSRRSCRLWYMGRAVCKKSMLWLASFAIVRSCFTIVVMFMRNEKEAELACRRVCGAVSLSRAHAFIKRGCRRCRMRQWNSVYLSSASFYTILLLLCLLLLRLLLTLSQRLSSFSGLGAKAKAMCQTNRRVP